MKTNVNIKQSLAAFAVVGLVVYGVHTMAGDDNDQVALACNDITDLAVSTHKARAQGLTEDMAMDQLRAAQVYSGIKVWAVKSAFDAPADVSETILRGSVFGECMKRGAV